MEGGARAAVEAELQRTWAGITLLQEVRMAELRAHVFAALASGTTTRKVLAAELGLSLYRLGCFVDGEALSEREWERAAPWSEGKADPHVSPYLVAVGVLCRWFSPRMVDGARRELSAHVRRMYARRNIHLPEFVTEQLDELLSLVRPLPEEP